MKLPRLIVAGVALSVLGTASADAACSKRDLVGSWRSTSIVTDSSFSNAGDCRFSIDRRGNLRGFCLASTPGFQERTSLALNIRIDSDCAIIARGREDDVSGSVEGQMLASDKNMFVAVGYGPFTVSSITAVKTSNRLTVASGPLATHELHTGANSLGALLGPERGAGAR